MNENRLKDQIMAIFGVFMTLFYVGIGLFVIIYDYFRIDKALKMMFGIVIIIYGLYRGIRSFQLIRESFFNGKKNDEL